MLSLRNQLHKHCQIAWRNSCNYQNFVQTSPLILKWQVLDWFHSRRNPIHRALNTETRKWCNEKRSTCTYTCQKIAWWCHSKERANLIHSTATSNQLSEWILLSQNRKTSTGLES
jgi:hypothetical protein